MASAAAAAASASLVHWLFQLQIHSAGLEIRKYGKHISGILYAEHVRLLTWKRIDWRSMAMKLVK